MTVCFLFLSACRVKDGQSFNSLLDNESIHKVEFRNGATGALYRTEDKVVIENFKSLMNSGLYRKAKTPKPSSGYLYSGKLNDKIQIGFAGGFLILNTSYYEISFGDEGFSNSLMKIVDSFGRVMPKNGVIP